MIDYKEAKKKISIISILRDWGYKFDKSKGKISPNFVLRDEHGKEIDRVIITNPTKSEEQGYWRRDGGKGDLITFIKENLNQFGVVGRNETDTVTKVLAKLMNIEEEKEQKRKEKASADTSEQDLFEDYELDQWLDDNGIREAKEFDLAQWERQSGTEHIDDMMGLPLAPGCDLAPVTSPPGTSVSFLKNEAWPEVAEEPLAFDATSVMCAYNP